MAWHPLDRLSEEQLDALHGYAALLGEMNRSINLISREDAERIFERHILHSLALTARPFPRGAVIVDWGTGGGLPAIPLAITCPDAKVVAVDAVGKKVRAVRAMARRLGLPNVEAWHGRADDYDGIKREASGPSAYSVSRATAPLAELWRWHARLHPTGSPRGEALRVRGVPHAAGTADWQPGLLALKGGDLTGELDDLRQVAGGVAVHIHSLSDLSESAFGSELFADKLLVECLPAEVN